MKKTVTIALAALVGFLGSCSKKLDGVDVNKSVFRATIRDDVKTLDPAVAYDEVSWKVIPAIYETLYQYSYLSDPYKVEPLLAADMPEYSKDRRTVTIKIRKGVKYRNDEAFKDGKGRELEAKDFVYGWKRLAVPQIRSQGFWILENRVEGAVEYKKMLDKAKKEDIAGLLMKPLKGLKVIDRHTLQIKLTRPYPQLLYVLTMPFTSPMPVEAIEKYGDDNGNINHNAVGTGPFYLKEWKRGHEVVLERNEQFHPDFYPTESHPRFEKLGLMKYAGKALPFLNQIRLKITKESQPAWLNFLVGNLDVMGIPKDNFQDAITNQINLSDKMKSKEIQLQMETGSTFYYISFNMKDKVVGKNKILRQAMSAAIDREEFIKLFTNGRGRKATTVLPPGIADRPQTSSIKYDLDLERAKKLLAKAGYPEGKGLPALNFDTRGASSLSRQMGDFFAQQWAKIGIKINIVLNTFPAYLEKAKQGNLQVSLGGWILDYPDAENAYQLLYGPNKAPGPNESNFDHKEMNRLFDIMAATESGPERAKVVQQMDDILQEECPWALLYYVTDYYLYHSWLENYRGSRVMVNTFKYYNVDNKKRLEMLKKL